ncbi:MAG: bifunctional glutamate N-acetyltransferase/amino-acid acetyltransferase ArgJ [Pseudomonadales bacterium]|nr:bifunctional glutamate N-acetyltransferase/amino-acid acetyltransferase ArgJ [Pseudomonadales bacterium]
MAVGPDTLVHLQPVDGVSISCARAGIKKPGRDDLVLFHLNESTTTAAVFTSNAFCAAPVQLARSNLSESSPRYLLINTGNANAGTGPKGMQNAVSCCEHLASLTSVNSENVLPFSTGVIGEHLPVDKIISAMPDLLSEEHTASWLQAARGIMTTDTRPKGHSVRLEIDGEEIVVTGISKGAGMIKPNMATMLAFVATNASVSPACLNAILQYAVNCSFNRITVDGDTSTNDACVLFATAACRQSVIEHSDDPRFIALRDAITKVFVILAQLIIRDAEGATKFVTVTVRGGASSQECLLAAYAVAESPLVKTALFASDPNWGRILAAVGRAGIENLDVKGVNVYLGDLLIAESGGRADAYQEAAAKAIMTEEEIRIVIELGRGGFEETVWTSDFSHDYVTINAEYRT